MYEIALTVGQPWATLIVTGAKRFEVRHANPLTTGDMATAGLLGRRILIHAARSIDNLSLRHWPPFAAALESVGVKPFDELPAGAIIGAAYLVAVHAADAVAPRLSARELALGSFGPGRWALEFDRPELFPTPIPCSGAPGFWPVKRRTDTPRKPTDAR